MNLTDTVNLSFIVMIAALFALVSTYCEKFLAEMYYDLLNNNKVQMKKNQITTVDQLQLGDRFYKLSDTAKVKNMYQVMDTTKQVRTAAQKHFACPISYVGSKVETQKTVPLSGNIQVVFMRNVAV
jgi:hypothetical protein